MWTCPSKRKKIYTVAGVGSYNLTPLCSYISTKYYTLLLLYLAASSCEKRNLKKEMRWPSPFETALNWFWSPAVLKLSLNLPPTFLQELVICFTANRFCVRYWSVPAACVWEVMRNAGILQRCCVVAPTSATHVLRAMELHFYVTGLKKCEVRKVEHGCKPLSARM